MVLSAEHATHSEQALHACQRGMCMCVWVCICISAVATFYTVVFDTASISIQDMTTRLTAFYINAVPFYPANFLSTNNLQVRAHQLEPRLDTPMHALFCVVMCCLHSTPHGTCVLSCRVVCECVRACVCVCVSACVCVCVCSQSIRASDWTLSIDSLAVSINPHRAWHIECEACALPAKFISSQGSD